MQIDNVALWPEKDLKRVFDDLTNERNALRDEVAELKRKLAEVEGERDALRAGREAIGKGAAELTSKNDALRELNALLYGALENIANQGYLFDVETNVDLAKRVLKLHENRAK